MRRLLEDNDAGGVQPAVVAKLQRIVSFLQDMEQESELRTVASTSSPAIERHLEPVRHAELASDAADTPDQDRIVDLDYEDYH